MTATVGMVGWCCDTGLGICAADYYAHLPLDRWLVVEHAKLGVDRSKLDERCTVTSKAMEASDLGCWLDGLDAVMAVQQSYVDDLWSLARARGIKTVLIVNAEWFRPEDPETQLIDLFIAPTRDCAAMLDQAGFASRTRYLPRAIDTDQFAFRHRERAETFVYFRGWGGWRRPERKGTSVVLEAARRCPEVPFIIRYQRPLDEDVPTNVRLLGPVEAPEDQYDVGDIAVQPSRWEGIGRQILEAMSCGLPTIVPDAPPMNEYPTDRRLCVPARPEPFDLAGKPYTAWEMDINRLVDLIRELHGQPIAELSEQARARIEQQSWTATRRTYLEVLDLC